MAKLIGETDEPFSATNPHPGHGKDDNIANELGHTVYPKYLHKFDETGKITVSKIVNDEDENDEAEAEGFAVAWVKPKVVKEKSKTKDPFGK